VLGLVFKTSVRHFVSQVGSTPTSFRHLYYVELATLGDCRRVICGFTFCFR
jgi:hypothetical protein